MPLQNYNRVNFKAQMETILDYQEIQTDASKKYIAVDKGLTSITPENSIQNRGYPKPNHFHLEFLQEYT